MKSLRSPRKIDKHIAHAAYSADINFTTIIPYWFNRQVWQGQDLAGAKRPHQQESKANALCFFEYNNRSGGYCDKNTHFLCKSSRKSNKIETK